MQEKKQISEKIFQLDDSGRFQVKKKHMIQANQLRNSKMVRGDSQTKQVFKVNANRKQQHQKKNQMIRQLVGVNDLLISPKARKNSRATSKRVSRANSLTQQNKCQLCTDSASCNHGQQSRFKGFGNQTGAEPEVIVKNFFQGTHTRQKPKEETKKNKNLRDLLQHRSLKAVAPQPTNTRNDTLQLTQPQHPSQFVKGPQGFIPTSLHPDESQMMLIQQSLERAAQKFDFVTQDSQSQSPAMRMNPYSQA